MQAWTVNQRITRSVAGRYGWSCGHHTWQKAQVSIRQDGVATPPAPVRQEREGKIKTQKQKERHRDSSMELMHFFQMCNF